VGFALTEVFIQNVIDRVCGNTILLLKFHQLHADVYRTPNVVACLSSYCTNVNSHKSRSAFQETKKAGVCMEIECKMNLTVNFGIKIVPRFECKTK
jgi:hypothetical protein